MKAEVAKVQWREIQRLATRIVELERAFYGSSEMDQYLDLTSEVGDRTPAWSIAEAAGWMADEYYG